MGPLIDEDAVRNVDELVQDAGRRGARLAASVFTNDFYQAWKAARSIEVGEVTINEAPSHGIGYFPFGGTGDSGIGRQGIGYSIDEMTRLKTVVFNLEPAGLGKSRQVFKV